MPQYCFTDNTITLIEQVDEIAKKEKRSRSEMIDILLRKAVHERYRKSKKNNTQHNTQNVGESNR